MSKTYVYIYQTQNEDLELVRHVTVQLLWADYKSQCNCNVMESQFSTQERGWRSCLFLAPEK